MFRPSLEAIINHPFFTHDPLKIPESLPACCTHVAPDWQEERSGRLVPVLAEADEAKYRSKISSRNDDARKKSGLGQQKDLQEDATQHHYPTQQVSRQPSQGELQSQQVNHPSSKFEIFDEMPQTSQRRLSSNPLPQFETKTRYENPTQVDEISEKMSRCNLQQTPSETRKIDAHLSQLSSPKDNDLRALEIMHDRIRESYERVDANGGPKNFRPIREADDPGAQIWVTRYVDYTSKYGLGFLFNDGR